MQSQNRFFDDLARVAAGAMGTLSGVKSEVESRLREQLERVLCRHGPRHPRRVRSGQGDGRQGPRRAGGFGKAAGRTGRAARRSDVTARRHPDPPPPIPRLQLIVILICDHFVEPPEGAPDDFRCPLRTDTLFREPDRSRRRDRQRQRLGARPGQRRGTGGRDFRPLVRLSPLFRLAGGNLRDAFLLRLRHEGAKGPARRGLRAAGARQRKAVARPFRPVGRGQFAGLSPCGAAARRDGGERRAGRGSGRYRPVGMRALLPGVPARACGAARSRPMRSPRR